MLLTAFSFIPQTPVWLSWGKWRHQSLSDRGLRLLRGDPTLAPMPRRWATTVLEWRVLEQSRDLFLDGLCWGMDVKDPQLAYWRVVSLKILLEWILKRPLEADLNLWPFLVHTWNFTFCIWSCSLSIGSDLRKNLSIMVWNGSQAWSDSIIQFAD